MTLKNNFFLSVACMAFLMCCTVSVHTMYDSEDFRESPEERLEKVMSTMEYALKSGDLKRADEATNAAFYAQPSYGNRLKETYKSLKQKSIARYLSSTWRMHDELLPEQSQCPTINPIIDLLFEKKLLSSDWQCDPEISKNFNEDWRTHNTKHFETLLQFISQDFPRHFSVHEMYNSQEVDGVYPSWARKFVGHRFQSSHFNTPLFSYLVIVKNAKLSQKNTIGQNWLDYVVSEVCSTYVKHPHEYSLPTPRTTVGGVLEHLRKTAIQHNKEPLFWEDLSQCDVENSIITTHHRIGLVDEAIEELNVRDVHDCSTVNPKVGLNFLKGKLLTMEQLHQDLIRFQQECKQHIQPKI